MDWVQFSIFILAIVSLFFWNRSESLKNLSYQRMFTFLQDVPNKRIIWQPRLTKPKAQPNSMLFKAYPGTDNVKVVWIIPAEELWTQYEAGKMTENKTVLESIYDYKHNRAKLEAAEDDDVTESTGKGIYRDIAGEGKMLR